MSKALTKSQIAAAIAEKRANPDDRIISSLAHAQFAGERPLTDQGREEARRIGAALGDLRLGARYRLLGSATGPVQLSLAASLWLPAGDRNKFAGDGSVRGLPAVSTSLAITCAGAGRSGLPMPRSMMSSPPARDFALAVFTSANT